MPETWSLHIGKFVAVDKSGNEYDIHVFQDRESHGFIDSARGELVVDGLERLETSDGRAVLRKDKGCYEIADTETVITSSDPAAP